MTPYYLTYGVIGFLALIQSLAGRSRSAQLVLPSLYMLLVLIVGTRDRIGADWGAYLRYFEAAGYRDFLEALTLSDPGYILVGWLVYQAGGGIGAANVVYALIAMVGLFSLARRAKFPLIFLCAAWPYLVMVVMMGYARQGVAVGLVMLAISMIDRGRGKTYVGIVVLAALFHKSAAVMLCFAAFDLFRRKWLSIGFAAATLPFVALSFVDSGIGQLTVIYLDSERESRGALVRVALISVFAAAFILFAERRERVFWRVYAWVALLFPIAFLVSPSSTVVDRIALYFFPLMMLSASEFPVGFFYQNHVRPILQIAMIGFFGLQMHIWLNTTTYDWAWIPYRSFLF